MINAKTEAEVRDPTTSQLCELDLWLPSLSLAFEFQVSLFTYLL